MAPRLYLDTNVFIEAFERADAAQSPVWPVLNAIEDREFDGVTSELTLAELLPKLISESRTHLIAFYQQLFSEVTVVDAIPITRRILMDAAHLRASRTSIRLPDAIHLATAAASNCIAVLSNDMRLSVASKVPLVPIAPDCLSSIRNIGL